jgi:hypothetical protein
VSRHRFCHDPTPKELFDGLAEAYRRERKRVGGTNPWRMSPGARPAAPEAEAAARCSRSAAARRLTLVLSSVADAVR